MRLLGQCRAVVLLGALGTGGAQAMAQAGPRQVATELFAALQNRDWSAAARAFDPAERQEFRDVEVATLTAKLELENERGSGGVSIAGPPDPEATRRLAATRVTLFRGARTFGDIVALSPEVFLARYFEALDAEFGIVGIPRVVVGDVLEADTLAHVLYRPDRAAGAGRGRATLHDGGWPPWQVAVLTLRRHGERWYALPNGELFAWRVPLLVRD